MCRSSPHPHSAPSSQSPADINDALILKLRDLSHTMRFLYEGKGSQKRVLIVLRRIGPVTQRELTRQLGIQPGSASEVIAKLESAGLIVRTPSAADRRTADIGLTEAGRAQAEQAMRQRQQRHKEMFACLTDEEKQTLLTLLQKVSSDWSTHYREKDGG